MSSNMLAEALADISLSSIRHRSHGTAIVFDMQVRPDTKNFRPGMPMDTLTLTLTNQKVGDKGIQDVTVSIKHKKVAANGQLIMSSTKELPWAEARHFLRALLATQKLFDFKQHEPFYTIINDEGRKQTV